MCRSEDSEGSLLPLLSWKVRAMQAFAEAALSSSARREEVRDPVKEKTAAKKTRRGKPALRARAAGAR